MRKRMKFAVILAVAILLFACDTGDDPKKEEETGGGDFTSHNTDYSILVRNNTNFKLVAFKGDLQADKLIGGIPAHANNHGLPYKPALFDKTEDFPLILLTEAQYNNNKNNLLSQKNTPFTRVYVFYNKQGDNSSVYEIAEGLGGTNKLRIINTSTTINVEIRLGGVAGETIGYAPAGIQETTLKLEDGDYIVFPVFKRYNRIRDVVETVYPKRQDGQPWRQSISLGDFGNGTVVSEHLMNLNELMKNLVMTSGAAWIIIDNQTEQGVRFLEGGTPRKTLTGREYTSTSAPLTWQIDMPKLSNNNYADSRDVSNWKFGPSADEVSLQESKDVNTILSTVTIERDKLYTITVSGQAGNPSNPLKAYISSTTNIDVSDFDIK